MLAGQRDDVCQSHSSMNILECLPFLAVDQSGLYKSGTMECVNAGKTKN